MSKPSHESPYRNLRSRLLPAFLAAAACTALGFAGGNPATVPATVGPALPRGDTLEAPVEVAAGSAGETESVGAAAEVEAEATLGEGRASYYGSELAGRKTASGERFDPQKLTAAHPSLPFGTRLRVTNLRNGKSVEVRVNDRGPFVGGRIIDLSYEAAKQIGMIRRGTARVRIERLL